MTTLNFQITTAGRQAAIDADATGLQLKITEVGYGNATWRPDASATAPQDEFKRLPAGGGDNPAPLYVHVTTLDESSDTYQANEVSIYAGSVLFAIWSKGLQPDADGPGKINTQDNAFAFDLLLTDVPPGSVTVGDTNFSVPLATETKAGVSREATLAEVVAGELSKIFVSPAKLKAWWDQVRIWDNIKNKPATATRWPDHSEVDGLGSAATKAAGINDGDVALLGDPTTGDGGAYIIETGSNANGYWEKRSDGIMLQRGKTGETNVTTDGNRTYNFAIPFPVSADHLSLTISRQGDVPSTSASVYGTILDASKFEVYDDSANGAANVFRPKYWSAWGRWK